MRLNRYACDVYGAGAALWKATDECFLIYQTSFLNEDERTRWQWDAAGSWLT